jgi:hypothetical protein
MKNKENNKETLSPLAKKLEDFALRPDDNAWEQFQALRQTQPSRRPHYGNRRWLFGVGLMAFFFSACLFATLIAFEIDLFGSQKTTPSVNTPVLSTTNVAAAAAEPSLTASQTSFNILDRFKRTKSSDIEAFLESNKTKTSDIGRYLSFYTVSKTQLAVSKTQMAASKIQLAVSKTQMAASKIQNVVSKTQTSASKIQNVVSKTQTSASKIQNVVSKTQTSVSKIQNVASKTQTSVSKIQNVVSKTQTSVSKIQNVASKTQNLVSKTQTLASEIQILTSDSSEKTLATPVNDSKNDTTTALTNNNIVETTTEAATMREMPPLSILSVENGVSSFVGNLPPALPTLKKPLNPSMRNEIGVGLGISMIQVGVPQHRNISLGYFRRFTPLMALGATLGYSNDGKNGYTTALEAQLNFTLMRRPQFGLYLTTGYGFRNWRLPESRSMSNGSSKGVTIGMEGRYFFSKHYFTGLRVDMKETFYSNFGMQVQVGKLF